MSRKNVFAPVMPHEGLRAAFQTPQGIAAPIPAIGTIGRALGEARANSLRVEELQKELEAGPVGCRACRRVGSGSDNAVANSGSI